MMGWWVALTIVALLVSYVWHTIVITDGWALAVYGGWWYKITSTVSNFCKRTSKRVYWWFYDRRQEFNWWYSDIKRKMKS